ncbi:hypothetical protein [Manganibacter manganicus]|uniref:DUF4352 domain-containing protein n=1 Tax=Manganibacter manganicus TaxID=1873176 RepID=A0A1V8RLV7_9HYPH|nr:hypothetical protein [Pseudaminobacter manganicus]OQM74178.1 hypothetical protein BFN67_22355 [Pseudaminobacter manganicus]
MKNLRWLGVTTVLFVVTLVLAGWSDFKELSQQREWNVVRVNADEGELGGIRVGIREIRASVLDNGSDRSLLFVRIALLGSEADARSWGDCLVSVQDTSGRKWLPLYGFIRGAIEILAPDRKDHGFCGFANINENSPTTYDQIYRLPKSALDNLSLHVSGYGTRPAALSFPLKPEVREFKAE